MIKIEKFSEEYVEQVLALKVSDEQLKFVGTVQEIFKNMPETALKLYFQQAYSQYSKIYLTVNCKNPSAYRCYLKSGFTDIDDLYLGGAAGPQYIMVMV